MDGANDGAARLVGRGYRYAPVLFAVWSLVLFVTHLSGPFAVSWHSFVTGARVLLSPHALDLFARHAGLQIGPVTYVAVIPVVQLASAATGRWLAVGLCWAIGLALVLQLRRLYPGLAGDRARQRLYLIVGSAILLGWSQLAFTYVHPDDALALLLAVGALRAATSGRPIWAAVMVGLAADCKPWALGFAAIVLIDGRRRIAATAVLSGVVLAAWLPFYLADPGSLAAVRFRIANVTTSSLRILGVETSGTPSWDRPAQIALAVLLGFLAVRRGRWPAIVLVAMCARLLLDPSTKSYYDVELLVGAGLVDLLMLKRPWPVFTAGATVAVSLARVGEHVAPAGYGFARTAYLVIAAAAVLTLPDRILPGVSDS